MKLRPLVVLLALGTLGSATTIVPMSVEELTHAATYIGEVRSVETWSGWNVQHTLIYTYTRLEIMRTLKGESPATLVVKQLGGNINGYVQKVAGVRHFVPGEADLLFLRPSVTGDGTMVVVGLLQGHFRMLRAADGEITVSNGVVGVRTYRKGQIANFHGSPMSLEAMEARIRRAMQ